MKNRIRHMLVLAAAAAMVGFFTNDAAAQGFDPAEFRARQLDRYRESIGVKSEDDWKKLEPLVGKVMDAQTASRMGGGFGRTGRGGGGGGGGGGEGRDRNRQSNPEREALQKALEDKASADEIKTALTKYREARKEKEMAVEKAQEELRKALSPTQEAGAVLAGLLR